MFALATVFVLMIQFAPKGVAGLARALLARGRDVPAVPPDAKPARRDVPAGVPGAPLLRVDRVSQRFGRSRVLRDVSLTVERGQCVCLIGPNGAGKTTLLSVVTGHLRPSSGRVLLRGQDLTAAGVDERARLGVGRLFQVPSVFAQLTVADNRRLAVLASGSPGTTAGGGELTTAGELSMAERRHLELDMVLTGPPEMVLLDEPAAGLARDDAHALARRLRQVVADSGCGMVVVEHDMEIVRELADVVVVLAGGEVIASGSMDEIVADDAVRRAYLGEG